MGVGGAGLGRGSVCSLANYSVAYEGTQSNRVSDFHDLGRAAVCDCGTHWTFLLPFFVYSLFPKAIHFDFCFT